MATATLEQFRIPTIEANPVGVDRDTNTIKGVSVALSGDVPSHELHFDSKTLEGLVSFGKQAGSKGVKARFTHPGMLSDGLGTYLGTFRNFRIDGGKARADLQISPASFSSPKGDIGGYVMELAEEAPEAFGASVVVSIERETNEEGLPFARITGLHAVDLVDEPAANESLFTKHKEAKAMADTTTKPADKEGAKDVVTRSELEQFKTDLQKSVIEGVTSSLAEQRKADNERLAAITKECDRVGFGKEVATDMFNRNLSIQEVQGELLDKVAERQAETGTLVSPGRHDISFGADQRDKHTAAMRSGLMYRAFSINEGPAKANEIFPAKERAEGWEEFQNASLLDIARETLEAFGWRPRGASKEQIARIAMGFGGRRTSFIAGMPADFFSAYGWHTVGSFPDLTLDAFNKTMLRSYTEREFSWRIVFRQAASVQDFKDIHRIRMGEIANLDAWPDNTVPLEKYLNDEKETYAVEAHSNIVSFSWQTIVNDDMDAISRIPALLGNAAARTVNKKCWNVVTSNPTMVDGQSLFSDATGNRAKDNLGTAGAISNTTLNEMRQLMRLQVGVNEPDNTASEAILNLQPKYLVVPAALETIAKDFTQNEYLPADNRYMQRNQWNGLMPVVEPELDADSGTAWYGFADTSQVDTIETTFLQGQETPVVDEEQDFETWAIKYKLVQTFKSAAIDHRGCFKNAGA